MFLQGIVRHVWRAYSVSMNTIAKPRLSRERWIEAGFEALMDTGPNALKAEPLARRLNTTKGSFYWHFKDVPEFHAALLQHWQTTADVAVSDGNSVVQLRAMVSGLAHSDTAEPALRAWAKSSSMAAQAMASVDAKRLQRIDALLSEIGIANPEMSRILYAAALGIREVSQDAHATPDAIGTLVDLVLALR